MIPTWVMIVCINYGTPFQNCEVMPHATFTKAFCMEVRASVIATKTPEEIRRHRARIFCKDTRNG